MSRTEDEILERIYAKWKGRAMLFCAVFGAILAGANYLGTATGLRELPAMVNRHEVRLTADDSALREHDFEITLLNSAYGTRRSDTAHR